MINIMVPNWAKNILFLLVYMISGLVLVVIIEGLLTGSDLTPLNTVIEKAVTHIRTPVLTSFLVSITRVGNPFVFACVAVLLSVLLILKKYVYDALLFLAALIVAATLLTTLKNIFQISRPVSEVFVVDGWSFPSGHATIATAFFFLLSFIFFSKLHSVAHKSLLLIGSVAGILLICFSRLYLGAHWTLDILAGVALGLLSVSFTVLMFNLFIPDSRSVRKLFDI